MANFDAGNIARLGNLLKRSQETEQLQMQSCSFVSDHEAAASRSVTISRLPQEATVDDVVALFDDFGPVEVDLPRESRKKRHVGIAYVTLLDPRAAVQAVRAINGFDFRAASDPNATITRIYASLCVPGVAPPEAPERISWKRSDELWEVHMYNESASVDE